MKLLDVVEKVLVKISRSWRLLVAGYRYELSKNSGPSLDFIKVLRLSPGDILVIKVDKLLATGQVLEVEGQLRELLRGRNNVLVLDGGWSMEVVRQIELPTESNGK